MADLKLFRQRRPKVRSSAMLTARPVNACDCHETVPPLVLLTGAAGWRRGRRRLLITVGGDGFWVTMGSLF